MEKIQVIDSHTGGEPTRVVITGFPDLNGATMAEKRDDFRSNHDDWRKGIVLEPRGSEILVGVALTEPCDSSCQFGAIFFNNAGMLGMCGHGMIGLIETLKHLGRIKPGEVRIDTPVGVVTATLQDDGQVAVRNVASYRHVKDVELHGPHGIVKGDIAFGGNWFFLVDDDSMDDPHLKAESLQFHAKVIRREIENQHVFGAEGAIIDHVYLSGSSSIADSKNFVLCPGGAFDRSPCGTGTSAKMACLYDDGKLKPGDIYRQESITGSVFEGWVDLVDGQIIPTIRGRAWVTGESTLFFDATDPLRWGFAH